MREDGRLTPNEPSTRSIVIEALKLGPKTDREIVDATALNEFPAKQWRRNLVHEGLVMNSGKKRVAYNGNLETVWQLTHLYWVKNVVRPD